MKNKNLNILIVGQLISQIGDKFYMIAIACLVFDQTGSAAKMGLVLAASFLPPFILGFISGIFIDRLNQKWLLISTDLIRGIIILLNGILLYFDCFYFQFIIASQLILAINASFFDPTIPSIIPKIVTKKDLSRANARHQFVRTFSMIAGPAIGGILVTSVGYISVFILNCLSFLISAILESGLKLPSLPKAPANNPHHDSTLFKGIIDGYRYILSDKTFLLLLFIVALIHFFVGSIEVSIPVLAASLSDSLSGSTYSPSILIGFFQGAFGFGAFIVSFLLSHIPFCGRELTFLFGSICSASLMLIFIPAVSSILPLARFFYIVMFFVLGGSIIIAGNAYRTIIQRSTPSQYLGRVFAISGSIGNGSFPFSMLIYGFLFENNPFQPVLIYTGLALLVSTVLSFILLIGVQHGNRGRKTSSITEEA